MSATNMRKCAGVKETNAERIQLFVFPQCVDAQRMYCTSGFETIGVHSHVQTKNVEGEKVAFTLNQCFHKHA